MCVQMFVVQCSRCVTFLTEQRRKYQCAHKLEGKVDLASGVVVETNNTLFNGVLGLERLRVVDVERVPLKRDVNV